MNAEVDAEVEAEDDEGRSKFGESCGVPERRILGVPTETFLTLVQGDYDIQSIPPKDLQSAMDFVKNK